MTEARRRWAAMAALLVGLVVVVMDQTITAVLLPSIIDDLGSDVSVASLTITVFTVVAAIFLVPVGSLVDATGRRRAAIAAMVVFAVGSAVTGLATSVPMLLTGRAIQGFVLALYAPATIGLMNHLFPKGSAGRTLAFSLWATVAGSAAAVGPLLGGAFAQDISWRWAFFIGIPVCAAAGIAIRLTAPESRADRRRPIDVAGTVLLAIGVGTIVIALQEGGALGWITAPSDPSRIGLTPILLVVGVAAFIALWRVEARRARAGDSVLLAPSVLGVRTFRLALLASALMSMAAYAIVLMVSIYLQFVLLAAPLEAGLVLACLGAGSAIGGVAASRLIDRIGPTRMAVAGLAFQPLLLAVVLPLISDPGDPWSIAPVLAAYGLSYGAAFSALTNVTFADVPRDASSLAGGIASTSRLAAASLATAFMIATSSVIATGGLDAELARYDLTASQRDTVEEAAHFASGSGTSDGDRADTLAALDEDPTLAPLVDDVRRRLVDAIRGALALGLVLVAAGLVAAIRLARVARAPEATSGGAS